MKIIKACLSILLFITVSISTVIHAHPWVQCSMSGQMVQHCCCHQSEVHSTDTWQQPCCQIMPMSPDIADIKPTLSESSSNHYISSAGMSSDFHQSFRISARSIPYLIHIARAPPDRLHTYGLSYIQHYLL